MTYDAQPPSHGKPSRGDRNVPLSPLFEGRFGRMFRRLQPAPQLSDAELLQIAETMRQPSSPVGWGGVAASGDNELLPAGYTYFGQFLDHDVTFDPASSLDKTNDPDALRDFRTPRYDLDSLYGSGPADEPFQYTRDGSGKLLLSLTASGEPDLPRNSEGIALIGDPRNDENIIVSQLHVAFARLHNKFIDQVTAEGLAPSERFAEAQRRTRWHYQWVILNDYLPRVVGEALVKRLVKQDADGGFDFKLRYYRAKTRPYMPIEFSAAAFRFGHTMVRGIYNLNGSVTDRPIFVPGDNVGPLNDLRGQRALPDTWGIDWSLFFSIGGSVPQLSQKIDATLVPALYDLPGDDRPLPLLNLLRGQSMSLPSGQDVARHLKVERVFEAAELGVSASATPLWFYLLKESELDTEAQGRHLGPVGGRIVAEVLLGLLQGDAHSFVSQEPTWQPTVPDADGDGTVSLGDLLAFATS